MIMSNDSESDPQKGLVTIMKNELVHRKRIALKENFSSGTSPSHMNAGTKTLSRPPLAGGKIRPMSQASLVSDDEMIAVTKVMPSDSKKSNVLFAMSNITGDVVKTEKLAKSLLSNYQFGRNLGHGAYA